MRALPAAVSIALAAAACGGPRADDGVPPEEIPSSAVPGDADFDSQGHRGARGLLPENSIAGAREALRYGMRTIELDLAVTRDSVLVVSHEPTFNPTICSLDGSGYDEETSLFALTSAEVQTVDCGRRPHPDFPYQAPAPGPKPTFVALVRAADAFARQRGRALPFYNVEIKSAPDLDGRYTPAPAAFAAVVVGAIAELGIGDRVTVQSFDPRPLAYLSEHAPDLPLAGLVPLALPRAGFVEKFGREIDVFSPHHLTLTRGMIADYRDHGLRVVPWTVNDKSRMRTLLSWGVDGIITDYPDRLREVLDER